MLTGVLFPTFVLAMLPLLNKKWIEVSELNGIKIWVNWLWFLIRRAFLIIINNKDFWVILLVISCQSWRLWGISPNESGKLLRDNDYIGWSSNPRTPNRHAWHKRLVTGFEVSFVLRMEKNISLIPLPAIVGSLFRIDLNTPKRPEKNPPSMHPASLWNITRLYKCSLFGWRNSASVLQMFSSANQPTSINLDSSISACRKIDRKEPDS